MKKRFLIALAVFIALAVPFSVFAATSDSTAAKSIRGFFGLDMSKLTDKQKSDVTDYSKRFADLQKEFINKMVANGSLTKEQGDAEIKRIEDMQKNGTVNGFIPGFGPGRGGFRGHGGRDGSGMFQIDVSKLSDKQKTDILDSYKKMAEVQKTLIANLVSSNLITKEQGESFKSKIDALISDMQKNGPASYKDMLMGFGGPGGFCFGFGLKGFDNTTLTDKQKSYFTDYSNKMKALQTELVNKLVAAGVLTKDQGDQLIKNIENKNNIQMRGNVRKNQRIDMKSSATLKGS